MTNYIFKKEIGTDNIIEIKLYEDNPDWEDTDTYFIVSTESELEDLEKLDLGRYELTFEREGIVKRSTDRLVLAKERKIQSLMAHDTSEAVNAFVLNGSTAWIDAKTRDILLRRLNNEAERLGADTNTYALANYGIKTIAVSRALTLVKEVEIYATQCWDTTNVVHKRAIENLTTVADVEAYDFTTGYPDKININL